MYEPHNDLVVPRDDARIWRYMDLGKFLSILHNSILFFSRVDLLRDPYECMPNPSTVEDYLRRTGRDWQEMNRLMQGSRQWTYANSWHMNQFESAAMWELYLKTDEGVAIETTFGRFRDSFSAEKIQKVFIGQVNYIDYDTEPVPWDNFLFMPLHKRKSFAHEQELRALVWLLINTDTDTTRPPPPGINVHVQLTTLMQRVFVSPEAAGWYVEIIGSILEKYGYGTVPLVQSNLYSLK